MKKIILAGFGYLGKFIEQQADFNEKKVLYKLSRNPGKHRNGFGNHVEVDFDKEKFDITEIVGESTIIYMTPPNKDRDGDPRLENFLNNIKNSNLERIVYISTSGVYGFIPDKERPNNESTFGSLDNTLPQSVYLESKRMGETITLVWGKKFSVPVTIVRPSICYGPGIDFDDGRSFADFIKALVMSEDIILESDGKVFRNFCYVTDVIAGIFLVLLKV